MDNELIDISPENTETPENAVNSPVVMQYPDNTDKTPEKPKIKRKAVRSYLLAVKGQLIAKGLMQGLNQEKACLKAGYKPSTARYNSNKIITNTNAREWFNKLIESKAEKLIEGLTDTAELTASAVREIKESVINGRDLKRAGVLTSLVKESTRVTQDLLDRAGYDKINKHMSIKKVYEGDSIEDIDKRMMILEAQLSGKDITHSASVTLIQGTGDTQDEGTGIRAGMKGEGAGVTDFTVIEGSGSTITDKGSGMDAVGSEETERKAEKGRDGGGPSNVDTIQASLSTTNSSPDLIASKDSDIVEADNFLGENFEI